MRRLTGIFVIALAPLFAEGRDRYALILDAPPLTDFLEAKGDRRAVSTEARDRVRQAQSAVRQAAVARGAVVTGSVELLANAIFVRATEEQAAQLRTLAGVKRVQQMLPIRRQMDRAAASVNATGAWNAIGGFERAGAGVKIGVLDTGIDHTHPVFQDASLRPPAGFPLCRAADCDFTNSKVIVARSYVQLLVLGEFPEDSRPDDLSPRDRVGHGTAAAMIAAGGRASGPAATVSGIAPKAFLGNYKIFGSPGVNDVTFDDVLLTALEDAFRDGMDIVSLSLGRPALWGPKDSGDTCGLPGEPCDLRTEAVERAVRSGMTVVVSAGNDGDLGIELPTLNSIHSPGTAPAAITVGAVNNAHAFFSSLRMEGNAPADLRRVAALFGNGPKPNGPLTVPLVDVAALGDDGRACAPLLRESLRGAIALIERGDCSFATKVRQAQSAGALGAVIFQRESNFIFVPTGLAETGIPAVLIGANAGRALKNWLASNPGALATLDPALGPIDDPEVDVVSYFSSQGPGLPDSILRPGEIGIKPELVAPGTGLYVATQNHDPNGDMYAPNRYTSAQGTSFSAPIVAGAVALVKQRYPNFTAAQLKSAVVNTASDDVGDYDFSGRPVKARITGAGAGKVNAAAAIRISVTAEPATVSFGVITSGAMPVSRTLRLVNGSTSTARLTLAASQVDRDPNARVTLSATSLTLNGGAMATITVRLEGSMPQPGAWEGAVMIEGGGSQLRVPYLYMVGDGVAHNAFPLRGFDFTGVVSGRVPGRLTLKVVDRYGVPVRDLAVRFGATLGGGSVETPNTVTDEFGIAERSRVFLGPQLGEQEFAAEAGALTVVFPGRALLPPTIRTDGVVNAASGRTESGVAPGSYISIHGRGLSESFRVATTRSLPLSLAGVSVSFDAPAQKLSLPGRIHFVSDEQINVQTPWELEGLNTAKLKVSIGDLSSAVYDLRLAEVSPALFEYVEPSTGRQFAAARNQDFGLIGTPNPARRGGIVLLYANGLGPVTNRPATGEPALAEPLSSTRVQPRVTIGGRPADVFGSVLAPSSVGLYQVNVRVPSDVSPGIHPVVLTMNGIQSKASSLIVE